MPYMTRQAEAVEEDYSEDTLPELLQQTDLNKAEIFALHARYSRNLTFAELSAEIGLRNKSHAKAFIKQAEVKFKKWLEKRTNVTPIGSK